MLWKVEMLMGIGLPRKVISGMRATMRIGGAELGGRGALATPTACTERAE
jgi:hypothetical protein